MNSIEGLDDCIEVDECLVVLQTNQYKMGTRGGG